MSLLEFARSIECRFRELLAPFGIDPLDLRVLAALEREGFWMEKDGRRYYWKNLSRLARELDEDRKTLARVLERLGHLELVRVQRTSVRRTDVALLEAGETLLRLTDPSRSELERSLMQELVTATAPTPAEEAREGG